MTRILGHIKSNVVAYLALFIALGGTSYAAVSIPRHSIGGDKLKRGAVGTRALHNHSVGQNQLKYASVGSKQLRRGSVRGAQINRGAVGSAQLAPGSVGPAQLNAAAGVGFGGYVRAFAVVTQDGGIAAGSPGAATSGWSPAGGLVTFGTTSLDRCAAIATAGATPASVSTLVLNGVDVEISPPYPSSVTVAVLCPPA